MIRIAQIVEHSIWEYQNGNIKLAESMLNYALKLAKKKKSPKYKGTSKNVPTNMALYNRCKTQAKKKFDVWPSAYGSAYLTKLYKSKGGTYRSKG
jgi:hypothetical protein